MKQVMFVCLLLFYCVTAIAQKSPPLSNDLPYSAGTPPDGRVRAFIEQGTNKLKGRLPNGQVIDLGNSDLTQVNQLLAQKAPLGVLISNGDTTKPVVGANLVVIGTNGYIVPSLIGAEIQGILPSLSNINQFKTCLQTHAVFDGSVWSRKVGTKTIIAAGYGIMFSQSINGIYYERVVTGMGCNVKWFGAKGTGNVDDSGAINLAVAYIRSLQVGTSPSRIPLFFPANNYFLIENTINLTNLSGIAIIGDNSGHLNSVIYAHTGNKPLFDCIGTSYLYVKALNIQGVGDNASTTQIAFLIGLNATGNGGLNLTFQDNHIMLSDITGTALGSCAIFNVRGEECFYINNVFRANTGLVLTYNNDIAATGIAFTATSNFANIATGGGSMGNVEMIGNRLHIWEKRNPGLILNGANGILYEGYIGRLSSTGFTQGTNETLILAAQGVTGLKVFGTVESFSTVFTGLNCSVQNVEININSAANTSSVAPVYDFTGCFVRGGKFSTNFVTFQSRVYAYHAPGGTGNALNTTFETHGLSNDTLMVSKGFLKRSDNVSFLGNNPFEKRIGYTRLLKNKKIYLGTVAGTLSTSAVGQFTEARIANTTSQNLGFYKIVVDGFLTIGGENDSDGSSMSFETTITVTMKPNGTFVSSSNTIFQEQSPTNLTFANIRGIIGSVSFANGIGKVLITPDVGGATGATANFAGNIRIYDDFLFNNVIPF